MERTERLDVDNDTHKDMHKVCTVTVEILAKRLNENDGGVMLGTDMKVVGVGSLPKALVVDCMYRSAATLLYALAKEEGGDVQKAIEKIVKYNSETTEG